MAESGSTDFGPGADRDALLRRIRELDQSLEQALVTAEDAQEEARLLADDHARMEARIVAQDREINDLNARIAVSEASRRDVMKALELAHGRLTQVRSDETQLTEALHTSFEELQVMTEELGRANADLERRVQERTADLAAANLALRQREEQLRFAQRCAGAGAWDWHVPNGRVEWSPECYDLMGLEARFDRPSMDRVAELLMEEDRAALARAVQATLSGTDDEFRAEFRIRHPTRGTLWITSIGRVAGRDLDGRPTRVSGLILDITDRRHLEDRLRRAREEAEAADRAKTRFLAAASHDLRQPIQAAALYAHVLRSMIGGKPQAAEALSLLKLSIDALSGMLDGLLDLSRLDAGAVEVKPVVVRPVDILRRLHAEFQGMAEAAGATLRCLSTETPVRTDPQLLERLLRNLLSNAVAHGTGGARPRILIGCRRRGPKIEFQVVDNGRGIPEEARDSIFEEFHQLHNPERNATRGFGLGLSIVARMARLLDSRVELRSRVGHGSVFALAVPMATLPVQPPWTATARDAVAPPRLTGRTILLVEDDAGVRNGLAMLLRGWGSRVIAVGSIAELEEGLSRLRRRPHALVTDYRLPEGRTGRSAVELVRQRWDVPGIIITGDTAPERLREARSIGCLLLHKPVDPGELADALETATRAGRRRRPDPSPSPAPAPCYAHAQIADRVDGSSHRGEAGAQRRGRERRPAAAGHGRRRKPTG